MAAPEKPFPPWVRQRYEAGEILEQLADEAGIAKRTLQRRAKKEKWTRIRDVQKRARRNQIQEGDDPAVHAPPPIDQEVERIQRELERAKARIEQCRRDAPHQYLAIIDHLKVGLGLRLEALQALTPAQRLARPISEDKTMAEIASMVAELEDRITGFLYQPVAAPDVKQTLEITITREVIGGDISSIDVSDPAAELLAERDGPEGESAPEGGGSSEPN